MLAIPARERKQRVHGIWERLSATRLEVDPRAAGAAHQRLDAGNGDTEALPLELLRDSTVRGATGAYAIRQQERRKRTPKWVLCGAVPSFPKRM